VSKKKKNKRSGPSGPSPKNQTGQTPKNKSPRKASQSARRRSGNKLWTAVIIVAVLVGGIIAWQYWSQPALDRLTTSNIKGAKDGRVQIREFSDYG
jgi:hypothetical protein